MPEASWSRWHLLKGILNLAALPSVPWSPLDSLSSPSTHPSVASHACIINPRWNMLALVGCNSLKNEDSAWFIFTFQKLANSECWIGGIENKNWSEVIKWGKKQKDLGLDHVLGDRRQECSEVSQDQKRLFVLQNILQLDRSLFGATF